MIKGITAIRHDRLTLIKKSSSLSEVLNNTFNQNAIVMVDVPKAHNEEIKYILNLLKWVFIIIYSDINHRLLVGLFHVADGVNDK